MIAYRLINSKKIVLFFLVQFLITVQCYSQNKCCSKVNSLNIRSEANSNASIVGSMNKGECLTVISMEENWVKVKTDNSEIGYVSSAYVDFNTSDNLAIPEKKENNKTWIVVLIVIAIFYFLWREILNFILEIYVRVKFFINKKDIKTHNKADDLLDSDEFTQEELQDIADELMKEGWEFNDSNVLVPKKQNDILVTKPVKDNTSNNISTNHQETTINVQDKQSQVPNKELKTEKNNNFATTINFYCEYCGAKASSVASLTKSSCAKHPSGLNKGSHKLYEGTEKSKYCCKYCGANASSILSLTRSSCAKHPNGLNKGNHSPAL